METLPILFVSSFDPVDPLDEGLELPRRNDFSVPESPGDFGAVRGENPDGGLEVRMTGGVAASSSKDSSSIKLFKDGCSYAP